MFCIVAANSLDISWCNFETTLPTPIYILSLAFDRRVLKVLQHAYLNIQINTRNQTRLYWLRKLHPQTSDDILFHWGFRLLHQPWAQSAAFTALIYISSASQWHLVTGNNINLFYLLIMPGCFLKEVKRIVFGRPHTSLGLFREVICIKTTDFFCFYLCIGLFDGLPVITICFFSFVNVKYIVKLAYSGSSPSKVRSKRAVWALILSTMA